MSRRKENKEFFCDQCGKKVNPLTNGSYRNHCPFCLFSKHVDVFPGDRLNSCGGLMKPISIKYNFQKGYQILHKCQVCGEESYNIIAQNTDQTDDLDLLVKLMQM